MKKIIGIFILNLLVITPSFAVNQIANLTINYKTVNYTGTKSQAIAVNNQIPAPTLHFKEGDEITLNVCNQLDKETAIHWHGILVPWQMDGVQGVSQHGIAPNTSFKYRFKLLQSGTYWYHAHAGLQEQKGLYGAFIVDPIKPPSYKYNEDYVIVLSDWMNTHPEKVLANLKKDGDYYSPNFPLQASLTKFIRDYSKADCQERKNLMQDYMTMQQSRMSIYDINDIAYQAFLLNGHPKCHPWTGFVKPGDTVRLRFIGASAETIFHVKIPGTTMQMVQADGNDVLPYEIKDFTIAPGETFDVLVKIDKNEPYIIYAESLDTVGAAYGALITQPQQFVNYQSVLPFPEPLPVTRLMMKNMMQSTNHHANSVMAIDSMKMDHDQMNMTQTTNSHSHQTMIVNNVKMDHRMKMATEPTIIGDKISPYNGDTDNKLSSGTKYQNLTSQVKTNNPSKPVNGVINMQLFGYMNHFIWMINGTPEYRAKPIILEPNKRYRIIFTNTSMMRHPMHIHGHWFILRNGHGEYDPLLHTIEVEPGSTVVADVDTDASGQWFFHCHMLYHMAAGMSRVFQYSSLIEITQNERCPQNVAKPSQYHNRPIVKVDEVRPIDESLVCHPMAHHKGFWLANWLDIGEDPFHNVQQLTYKGLYGPDYNKLELFINDAELDQGSVDNADIDIFYWHLISQFWAIKGGMNYFYRPAITPYWQPGIGIEGLMPFFIDTDLRTYYYSGSTKLDLELSRDTLITNNFYVRLGVRSILASKSVNQAQIGSGLNQMRYTLRPYYQLMPGLNVFAEYEHDQDYGPFKNMQSTQGEPTSENTLTFGLSVLF